MGRKFKKWKTGFLTEKELELWELKSKGYTQEKIAEELGVRQGAVSQALSAIKEKLSRSKETIQVLEKPKATAE